MILVTGGAGYVGSHALRALVAVGEDAVVVDDLSEGHRDAVGDVPLVETDLGDLEALRAAFADRRPDAVLHFAASCYVGESVMDPALYWRQNVLAGWNLLECVREFEVPHVVFSSSCAVYGEPETVPIVESTPRRPINPYGRTKAAFEDMLDAYGTAYGLGWTALRYFNAAGADPSGEIGEDHDPEPHLVPLVLLAARAGSSAVVFGTDYETPDGSCVRDYVHVCDLADAHLAAVRHLRDGGASGALNLGTGRGASVLEVIEAARKVTGLEVGWVEGPRRAGDPAVLVADASLARETLGWAPRYTELEEIVATAWAWHRDHPDGFGDRS
jgi:UDP-glucose-4-epimerase GalE